MNVELNGNFFDRVSMRLLATLAAVAASASLVVACGGGGGGGTDGGDRGVLFGAIAVRINGLESGVIGGQTTQEAANTLALNQCGNNCEIKETFFGNKCGSTAYSTGSGGVMTWAVAETRTEANSMALLKCTEAGGSFCSVYRGACNVSTNASTTSGGVCFGSGSSYICQTRVCTVNGNGVICPDGQFCPFAVNNGVTTNPVCAAR